MERLAVPIFRVAGEYNKHLDLVASRVYEGSPYYAHLLEEPVAEVVRGLILQLMCRRTKPETMAVGDKTPRYTDHLHFLRKLFPKARFIHIVRDPRDVAVSRLHHALRAGYSDALDSSASIHSELVASAARAWVEAVKKFDAFASSHPEQTKEVRYEDLHSDAATELVEIFDFLDVPHEGLLIEGIIKKGSFQKWSGREPGVEDKGSFFRKGVVGDGRYLERPIRETLEQMCSPWLERMGYERWLGDTKR